MFRQYLALRKYPALVIFVVFVAIILSTTAFAQQLVQLDETPTGPRAVSDARLFSSSDFESVPDNLEVPSSIADLVRELWRRSATFRRQCARIALAPNWRIHVIFTGVPFSDALAKTTFATTNGGHRALVMLVGADMRMVELIGHELEHVLEQFDGVDLALHEQKGARGVTRMHGRTFETARAVDAGKRVAREYTLASQQAGAR